MGNDKMELIRLKVKNIVIIVFSVVVVFYISSLSFSSDKSLVILSINVYFEQLKLEFKDSSFFTKADLSNEKEYIAISDLELKREWLIEAGLGKNSTLFTTKEAKGRSLCEDPGMAIFVMKNFGFIKLLSVSNQPCSETVEIDIIAAWNGFKWIQLFATVGGVA